MLKTTLFALSLILVSAPVLADCLERLDRATVTEQLTRSTDYLGPLPSDLNCVKPTSPAMQLVCGNADLLSLHHLNRYAQLVAYENATKQQVIGNDAFVLQVLKQVGNPAQTFTTAECACKSYVQSFQDAAGYDFKLLHAL